VPERGRGGKKKERRKGPQRGRKSEKNLPSSSFEKREKSVMNSP